MAAATISPKETTKDEDDHDSLPASTTATANNRQLQQSSPPPQLPHFPVWSWKPQSPLNVIPKAATAEEHDEGWLFWRYVASSQSPPISAPSSTLPHRNNRTLNSLHSSMNTSLHMNHPMISYQPHFLSETSFQEALDKWLQQLPETARSHHQQKISTNNNNNNRNDNKNDNVHGKWTYLPRARRRVALFDGRWWSQEMQMMNKTTSTTIHSTDPNQDTNLRNSSSSSSSRNSGVNIDKNPGSSSSRSSTDHDDGCLFPPPLQILIHAIAAEPIFPPHVPPNHILINEYSGAQDGILNAILRRTVIRRQVPTTIPSTLHHNDDSDNCNKPLLPFQVLLHGNGSCIVFQDDAYT
jgi:hypothetical protein